MKIYFNQAIINVFYLVHFQENFIQREIPVSIAGIKKVTAADQHEFDLLYCTVHGGPRRKFIFQ
jgi:hypothetical protein